MPKDYRSDDNDIDYDPDPVYLDGSEDSGPQRAKKQIENDTALPSQRGERLGPQRVFVGSNDDGEGIEIAVDDEKQWYVIHCYSGYENKVRHAIEQRIET